MFKINLILSLLISLSSFGAFAGVLNVEEKTVKVTKVHYSLEGEFHETSNMDSILVQNRLCDQEMNQIYKNVKTEFEGKAGKIVTHLEACEISLHHGGNWYPRMKGYIIFQQDL